MGLELTSGRHQSRENDADHGHLEHGGIRRRRRRSIGHVPLDRARGQAREPEHEEGVREDGAEERELHHLELASFEEEETDDHLGRVAECRIEEPANRLAGVERCLLRGIAEQSGERQDCKAAEAEDDGFGLKELFTHHRNRNKQQQNVQAVAGQHRIAALEEAAHTIGGGCVHHVGRLAGGALRSGAARPQVMRVTRSQRGARF